MTRSQVTAELRSLVIQRAGERCEYCLYPQADAFLAFQMEHIVSEKHGGVTEAENLALACPYCNRFKGSDLGSLDPQTGILTGFFNPRRQGWHEHFRLKGAEIAAQTPEGRVTVAILRFNLPQRIQERLILMEIGRYP